METQGVVADSSFYICFASDLKRGAWLRELVTSYSMYVGVNTLREISNCLSNEKTVVSALIKTEVDYYELIKPYFGRNEDHRTDGEYETIGIAYFLEYKGILGYIILDDGRARKFLETHFPKIKSKLVGTIGFIRDCCCKDKKLCAARAIEILNEMEITFRTAKCSKGTLNRRPCSIDDRCYNDVLLPTIEIIKNESNKA